MIPKYIPFTYTYIARQEGRQKILFILNYNTAWFLHWNKYVQEFHQNKKDSETRKTFPDQTEAGINPGAPDYEVD